MAKPKNSSKKKKPPGSKILEKKKRKLEEIAREVQKRKELQELIERGKSEWAEARTSEIHSTGLFATRFIPKGTRIIEYVGPRLKTKKAEEIGSDLAAEVEGTGQASVFMFVLNKKFQVNGNQDYNFARFANHSCDPNAETDIIKKRIYIIAIRDIEEGAEITYDYSFDVGYYEDNPCRCGSENCVGYIVSSDQWDQLKKVLKKKGKKKEAKAKAKEKEEKGDASSKKKRGKKKGKKNKAGKSKKGKEKAQVVSEKQADLEQDSVSQEAVPEEVIFTDREAATQSESAEIFRNAPEVDDPEPQGLQDPDDLQDPEGPQDPGPSGERSYHVS